jgi:alkylation response protein AidB-like acyl-CoA dehydrogenase
MIYLMHMCAAAMIVAARPGAAVAPILQDIAAGRHLSTLAFSEAGSRSHFWAPVSRARRNGHGVLVSAKKSWVTSAAHAQSYVVSTQRPEATQTTDSTLYLLPAGTPGLRVSGPWDGMGLRATASSPMTIEAMEVSDDRRLTEEGGGFAAKLNVVLPWFNLASATVSLGICRAVVAATVAHLKTSKFEHLGNTSLGEALPTLRQTLAQMQIDTDGLAHRIDECVGALENPGPHTMLRVLEVKAAAGQTAIQVTSSAMHACGGAAFSKHTSIERYFRDAHAGSVMAPTVDVLREFIGKSLLGIPLF